MAQINKFYECCDNREKFTALTMTMLEERRLHVSKLFVELEFVYDVLEIPTLTDAEHENEEDKADGVPQQPSLILYPTMHLSLSFLACHTQCTA